jgi:hypothetical protein
VKVGEGTSMFSNSLVMAAGGEGWRRKQQVEEGSRSVAGRAFGEREIPSLSLFWMFFNNMFDSVSIRSLFICIRLVENFVIPNETPSVEPQHFSYDK